MSDLEQARVLAQEMTAKLVETDQEASQLQHILDRNQNEETRTDDSFDEESWTRLRDTLNLLRIVKRKLSVFAGAGQRSTSPL